MVNSDGEVSWIQTRATKCSGRRPGPQITAPAVLARAPFRQRCAVTRVSMKRRPSNRGANLSSAAAAAPLRRLLPAASSSLAGGDPCCTVVEGYAADAAAVAAADTAAAAAPHLISCGPEEDDAGR